jgi:hypothetical protein
MTPSSSIFRNEINTLGDFRGRVKVARDFAATRWQEASILATGSFFQGMSESVAANLKFLAQAPGAPTQEIGQAVTDYLVKDNAKNHRELYAAAKRAVADLRKDPARPSRFLTEDGG